MGGRGAGSFTARLRARIAAGDASFASQSDVFDLFIRRRRDRDPDGKFDIIAHGRADGIEVRHGSDKIVVNSRVAARLIKKLPGYHGQEIRLLSCMTGSSTRGFAQNLANKLGVTVEAPSDIIWAYQDGTYVIAASNESHMPDLNRRGRFVKFIPGGNRGGGS